MSTTLALSLLLFIFKSNALSPHFNASILRLPSTPPSPSSSPAFLKDVVEAISAKEGWGRDARVRVSQFDAAGVRVGDALRYEFHLRVGKTVLVLRFSEVGSWRKEGLAPDLAGVAGTVGDLEFDGPLDVHVSSAAVDDELSLLLPSMNIRETGLRRVLVGDGITIKVEGAEEVYLVHPYGINLTRNGTSSRPSDYKERSSPLGYSCCAPLVSLRIVGSASLVAYRTSNPESYIETAFLSHDTIELLPDKCYYDGYYRPGASFSFGSLQSRLALVEDRLQGSLGHRVFRNRSTLLLKAKITSPTLVKFQVELERDITEDDRSWKKVAEWKTKPVLERQLFEIVARVEAGGMEPWTYKKLKSPFIVADSTAWSNLMSNISFTQFPSIVVPPEALMLDIKW